jgi:hypothetical protein
LPVSPESFFRVFPVQISIEAVASFNAFLRNDSHAAFRDAEDQQSVNASNFAPALPGCSRQQL